MTTETRIKILIAEVLVIGSAVFGGIVYLFRTWPAWSIIGASGLFLFWILMALIPSPKNKTACKFYKLLYYPWAGLTILLGFTKPTIGIMSAYIFAFVVSMFPSLLICIMYIVI